MGSLGAVFLFVGASVKGDTEATFSAQGIAHLALFVAAATGFLGQAACTAWALRKARCVVQGCGIKRWEGQGRKLYGIGRSRSRDCCYCWICRCRRMILVLDVVFHA